MNGVLIVVAAIFAIAAFIGYKKGLIKIAASLAATLVIVLLVIFFAPYMSKVVRKMTPIEDKVKGKVTSMISKEMGGNVDVEIPREQQTAQIEKAELPEVLKKMLLENNHDEAYAALGVQTFVDYIGAYVAKIIADVIAFLIVLLISLVAIPFVIRALNIVNKLPVIGGVNRLAGGIAGLGIGLAIVWVFFIIITLAYSTKLGSACLANIEANEFLKKLYDGNILMNTITKF